MVDKGFQQLDGMAVLALPIGGDARGDAAEHVAGQVGDANPGEDEEAGVVDDPRQRGGPPGGGPSDPPVPRGALPGGGPEDDAGQRAARAGPHPILEVLADAGLVAEVVMPMEAVLQPGPGCALPGVADLVDVQRQQVAERACPGRLIQARGVGEGRGSSTAAGGGCPAQGGQLDPAAKGELAQQGSGGHVLELAVGAMPVPPAGQGPAELVAAPVGMVVEKAADLGQLEWAEGPALHRGWQHHEGPRLAGKGSRVPTNLFGKSSRLESPIPEPRGE